MTITLLLQLQIITLQRIKIKKKYSLHIILFNYKLF